MGENYRHMDAEQAERYVMGDSPEGETAVLEEHLLVCAPCRTQILKADAYLSSMSLAAGGIRRRAVGGSGRDGRLLRLLPALAAVSCVLLLGILTFRYHQPALQVVLLARSPATAPAGRDLELHPDLSGPTRGSEFRLEMVDASGRSSWRGTLLPERGAAVPPQRAGGYVVRVYSRAGELQREFRLDIR